MRQTFHLITFSDECPQKNLSLDEVLLLKTIEKQQAYLRIWKNTQETICLGIGKKVQKELFEKRCQKEGVFIIRRFSGGGTVFHNTDILNYTLTFPLEKFPRMNSLTDSYRFILKWINKLFFCFSKQNLSIEGSSDFCLNGFKVAGNAQSRKKKALLHHGSFLLRPQINAIERYLKEPMDQPSYRKNRSHRHFVSDLQSQGIRIKEETVLSILKQSQWIEKKESFSLIDHQLADELKKRKYGSDSWNLKF